MTADAEARNLTARLDSRSAAPNLVDALFAGLEREPDDWGERDLHVSDLSVAIPGEGCPRQLWLRLNGAKKRRRTLGELLMFDHGHRIEKRATELLERGLPEGWTVEAVQQSVTGKLPHGIRGTFDFMLRHISGIRRVLDFKTVRGRTFNFLTEPKPANVMQVRTYAMAEDTDGGDLLYIDREGQNGARHFGVERDDALVQEAIQVAVKIRDSGVEPEPLAPVLERRANKGPDSLAVKQPWNCDYCPYLDVSCPGALPPDKRDRGVVAKITDNNELIVIQQDMALLTEQLLAEQGIRV